MGEEERGGKRKKEEGRGRKRRIEEGGRKDNVKITINYGSDDIFPKGCVTEPFLQ